MPLFLARLLCRCFWQDGCLVSMSQKKGLLSWNIQYQVQHVMRASKCGHEMSTMQAIVDMSACMRRHLPFFEHRFQTIVFVITLLPSLATFYTLCRCDVQLLTLASPFITTVQYMCILFFVSFESDYVHRCIQGIFFLKVSTRFGSYHPDVKHCIVILIVILGCQATSSSARLSLQSD